MTASQREKCFPQQNGQAHVFAAFGLKSEFWMQRDHTVANMQHGSADLQKLLPEARVMTEKHAAGRVKTATMLPALLYHHALALGPACPQPEIMITARKEKKRKDYAFRRQFDEKPNIIPGCPGMVKVMIRSPKLRYDMSEDRAMDIPDQLMTPVSHLHVVNVQ